ncbi:MAG TPA: hypothetical protein VF808_00065 [Ktedonobacterales bacterium]
MMIMGIALVTMLGLSACAPSGASTNSSKTPTATALAGLPRAETVVLQDPLTSDTGLWPQGQACAIQADGYHITGRLNNVSTGVLCVPTALLDVTDFTASVQFQETQGVVEILPSGEARTRPCGLLFRGSDQSNFYGFGITTDGDVYVIKEVNGKLGGLGDHPVLHNVAAVRRGTKTVNTLTVRAAGTHFDFYVNDVLVDQVDDSNFQMGFVGLEVDPGESATFANFSLAVPTLEPVSTPPAPPTGVVTLQDTLTAANHSSGWYSNGDAYFRSDGYHFNGWGDALAPTDALRDATISVRVKQSQGPGRLPFGIEFRVTPEFDSYAFAIDNAGHAYFLKWLGRGEEFIIAAASNPAIQSGLNVSNVLEVRASGSHFVFLVNGVAVGQVDDTTYSSGRVGLLNNEHMEVVFTNLRVTTPA